MTEMLTTPCCGVGRRGPPRPGGPLPPPRVPEADPARDGLDLRPAAGLAAAAPAARAAGPGVLRRVPPARAGAAGGRPARRSGVLHRTGRGSPVRGGAALLVLHALAAIAGLVVPRILGELVDQAAAPGTLAATLNGLALAVAGVVVVQALMTFLALRTSAVFGQDVLAEAREYVVRTVLGLPLGRVESASSGDLVTRVTRDVGTMSPDHPLRPARDGDRDHDDRADGRRDVAQLPAAHPAAAGRGAVCCRRRPALPEAGAAGLHHRGRHVLADQLDPDRDGRGRAYGRGARAAGPADAGSSTSTSTCRPRPSATR